MAYQIQIKRCYEPPSPTDGARFLVDRLWPRGVRKEALRLTGWVQEVAPSQTLRKWFGHDPERWVEFRKRYFAELTAKRDAWMPILEAAHIGWVESKFGDSRLFESSNSGGTMEAKGRFMRRSVKKLFEEPIPKRGNEA
jgi:uncharacterized protein YeaO (DUF488 family)